MKLTWLGHSSFLLETAAGMRIVTDPYPQNIFTHSAPEADIVTCSHEHYDHNAVDTLPRFTEALHGVQAWEGSGVRITGYPCWHDEAQGQKRGPNTVFVFEADGLKIAHMGDIGEPLTPALQEALTGLDALLLPIGGTYTIDGRQAAEIMRALKPRYTVPMHYRIPGHAFEVLDDGSLFFGSLAKDIPVTHMPVLTFTETEGVAVLTAK